MYIEGDVPFVANNTSGNGMWGGDGIWAILLLALLGNRGFGFGGGAGGGEAVGYELGKVATTNDVASGFNNSAVLSSLNDIKLGQSQMQNFINQGFAGLNTSLLTGFHGVDNAVCTLGYQTQTGFNTLAHQLSDCCCATQRAIDGVNYNLATQTNSIVQAINSGNQRVLDYMQTEKINALTAENVALKGQISNSRQTTEIVSALSPCPKPAYLVANPNCCYQSTCGGVAIQ